MWTSMIAVRLASAMLLGALGFGITGIASANSSSAQPASIDLAAAPASMVLAPMVAAPVVVAPGGTVGVGGAGFIPNEPVVFWYNLPNATAAPLYVLDGQLVLSKPPTDDWWRRWQDRHPKDRRNARDWNDWRNRYQQNTTTLNANASGQIGTIFWDTGLAAGTYSIVAHGLTSGVNDVVIFTVT
jgi:hypothetical protein